MWILFLFLLFLLINLYLKQSTRFFENLRSPSPNTNTNTNNNTNTNTNNSNKSGSSNKDNCDCTDIHVANLKNTIGILETKVSQLSTSLNTVEGSVSSNKAKIAEYDALINQLKEQMKEEESNK